MKLKVTNVSKIAWNDEKITASSDEATAIIRIHNQQLQGQIVEGDEISILETGTAPKKKKA